MQFSMRLGMLATSLSIECWLSPSHTCCSLCSNPDVVVVGAPRLGPFSRSFIMPDLIGLELAARAGFNPNAAITLWNKMAKASEGSPPEFMSTHPASSSRIASLQAAIPKVMPLYEQAR